jgi:hypothetical protein
VGLAVGVATAGCDGVGDGDVASGVSVGDGDGLCGATAGAKHEDAKAITRSGARTWGAM